MTELYSDTRRPSELRLCDTDHACISARLAPLGVRFQHLSLPAVAFDPEAERDEVIGAYLEPLNALMDTLPCISLDVLNVLPSHPRLASLRRQFMTEHAHDVAEAQMMVWGRGILYMRAVQRVWALRCEAGDFVRLPPHMCHWFAIDARIGVRTVRLLENNRVPATTYRGRDMRGAYRPPAFDRGVSAH